MFVHGYFNYASYEPPLYLSHTLSEEINRVIADLSNDDIYNLLRKYYDQGKQSELEGINPEYLLQSDSFGQTMLHWAALKGDKEVAEFIIKKTDSLLFKSQTTLHNYTALHLAVHSGNHEVVKLLVDESGKKGLTDLANTPDVHGQTALHWAASRGNVGICRELFLVMSESAILSRATDRQQTALHFAVQSGNDEVVKLLVSESGKRGIADLVNTPDVHGQTALHWAASQGNEETCSELLPAMSDSAIGWRATERQQTALHFAVHSGNNKIVELLIEESKKRNLTGFVDIPDIYGQTALHWAVGKQNLEASKILVKTIGPDQINAKTENKNTALDFAKQSNNTEIINLLMKNGAN